MISGAAKARVHGSREARSQYLVFLDTNTLVNAGWLQPLIKHLASEEGKKVVFVPHYDNINDPVSYEYSKTPNNYITGENDRSCY